MPIDKYIQTIILSFLCASSLKNLEISCEYFKLLIDEKECWLSLCKRHTCKLLPAKYGPLSWKQFYYQMCKCMLLKAVQLDLSKIVMTPEVVTPIDMSFRLWYVVIIGPKGSPYQDNTYEIELHFPKKQSSGSPHVKFITPILHGGVVSNMMDVTLLENKYFHHQFKFVHFYVGIIKNVMSYPEDCGISRESVAPCRRELLDLFLRNREAYLQKVIEHAKKTKHLSPHNICWLNTK